MCDNCRIIETAFEGAAPDPIGNYMPLYRLLAELLRQKRIRVYAGDCRFESVPEILSSEKHDTVCFYLECESCHSIYFFGAFVHGVPSFRKVSDVSSEQIGRLIWGRVGTYFHRTESTIEVDLSQVNTPEELQYLLKDALQMPDWYGLNWDAFWDAITGLVALPDRLIVKNFEVYREKNPGDAGIFRTVMRDYNELRYFRPCKCVFGEEAETAALPEEEASLPEDGRS